MRRVDRDIMSQSWASFLKGGIRCWGYDKLSWREGRFRAKLVACRYARRPAAVLLLLRGMLLLYDRLKQRRLTQHAAPRVVNHQGNRATLSIERVTTSPSLLLAAYVAELMGISRRQKGTELHSNSTSNQHTPGAPQRASTKRKEVECLDSQPVQCAVDLLLHCVAIASCTTLYPIQPPLRQYSHLHTFLLPYCIFVPLLHFPKRRIHVAWPHTPLAYLAPPSPETRPARPAGVSPVGSAFSLSFSGVSAISELAMKMPESWRAMARSPTHPTMEHD